MADSRFVKLLSIPKSIYVSVKLLGWGGVKYALKLPIFVRYNCVLNCLDGKVIVKKTPITPKMLSIGFSSTGIFDKKYSRTILEIAGLIELEGPVCFGQGTRLSVGKTGTLSLGAGFSSTVESTFVCVNKMHMGVGTAIGWSAMVMDTDWHSVMNTETGELYQAAGEVYIGDYCWIGTRSLVLKNTLIPNGCILAANSTANKKYNTPNTLLAGTPAIEKKHNVIKSTNGDIQFIEK